MNKTIVISGGSKGLGKAIAERFAQAKFNLALCARTAEDLEKTKRDFLSQYPDIEIFTQVVDVKNKAQIDTFAAATIARFGTIDVLINNAGTYVGGEIHNEPDGVLEHLIETNLYSAYHLTRAFTPTMLANKSGHVFNICSVASLTAYPNGGSYSISKFAMYGFSKGLREELKDKGVKVTSILPGATWSDSWTGVDLPADRLMPSSDIGEAVFGAYSLSRVAVIEDLVIRPQLGDL